MKRTIIPYNPALKEKARKLRNTVNIYTEIMLWNYLKRKQMKGYNFHRQKPIDNYIVDFFDSELMLATEVDGESHYGNEMRDARRKKKIASYGIEFLRFDDLDIVINFDLVIRRIENWIDEYEAKKKLNMEKGSAKDTPLAPLGQGSYFGGKPSQEGTKRF